MRINSACVKRAISPGCFIALASLGVLSFFAIHGFYGNTDDQASGRELQTTSNIVWVDAAAYTATTQNKAAASALLVRCPMPYRHVSLCLFIVNA